MNALRFDRILTVALLAFSIWYAIAMFSYPVNAGRIPGIVAVIAIIALVVQLILSFRAPAVSPDLPTEPIAVLMSGEESAGATSPLASDPFPFLERDSYENLLAVRGPRLRRLLTISGFTIAFLVSAILVGFVLTTTLLLPAVILLSGERARVAFIAGLAGAVGSYLLIVQLLGLPLFDGVLLGG